MKIAFAGKGGVGKTTLTAWTADFLARQGHAVWMVDADTALSLGRASGLAAGELPRPLILREDLIRERVGSGIINLTPVVDDLPESLCVEVSGPGLGRKRLLLMGTVVGAGGGCACGANALLKALLSHIVLERREWVLVDLEAGVEHLGRGTVQGVDALVIVSEPSRRGLETAAAIGRMASELGLGDQLLAVNRFAGGAIPSLPGLPETVLSVPFLPGLAAKQLTDASVLDLPETAMVDDFVERMIAALSEGAGVIPAPARY